MSGIFAAVRGLFLCPMFPDYEFRIRFTLAISAVSSLELRAIIKMIKMIGVCIRILQKKRGGLLLLSKSITEGNGLQGAQLKILKKFLRSLPTIKTYLLTHKKVWRKL